MKYNINRNREPLTESDLTRGRNFNKVLRGYRSFKIPFYRSGRFLTTGSAIIVATAVALIMLWGDEQDKQDTFISTPLPQAAPAADTYIVNADSSTEISHKTGSKLYIPAGAFKTETGQAVHGKVMLSYREFHDQKDIFLSGIPMTYDSAGKTYIFESAGMMEITATQDGKPLAANPGEPIRVDMISNTGADRFNSYYLDTVVKKWINLHMANLVKNQHPIEKDLRGGDSVCVSDTDETESNPILIQYQQKVKIAVAEVKAVEKEKPMAINKADKSKTTFHIVVDAGEFPEIAMYKGVHFQVKDEKSFNPKSANTEWENVTLKKLTGMEYEVTFSKGDEIFKVIATPVLEGVDMAAAQKIYDKKFEAYQTKLVEKKAAEKKAEKELAEYQAKMQKQWQDAQQKAMDARKDPSFQNIEINEMEQQEAINRTGWVNAKTTSDIRIMQADLIFRTFVVAKFGVYNADCPYTWPSAGPVVASFKTENGERLNLSAVYLVTRGLNIVYPYYGANGVFNNFRFDDAKDNALWAVTKDNRLVVADIKSFKSCKISDHKIEFVLKKADKEIKTAEEARKFLEI